MPQNSQTINFEIGDAPKVVVISGMDPIVERIVGDKVEVSTIGTYNVRGSRHTDPELSYDAYEITISPNAFGSATTVITSGICDQSVTQSIQISAQSEPGEPEDPPSRPVIRLPENVVYVRLKL